MILSENLKYEVSYEEVAVIDLIRRACGTLWCVKIILEFHFEKVNVNKTK